MKRFGTQPSESHVLQGFINGSAVSRTKEVIVLTAVSRALMSSQVHPNRHVSEETNRGGDGAVSDLNFCQIRLKTQGYRCRK